jgi:hypothetical protein
MVDTLVEVVWERLIVDVDREIWFCSAIVWSPS